MVNDYLCILIFGKKNMPHFCEERYSAVQVHDCSPRHQQQ